MMKQPLITCIMPTANRQEFIMLAISNFLSQDYPNAELVIIDDGLDSCINLIPEDPKIRYFYTLPLGTIGTKRNAACVKAKGTFIIHWDDDDWYAPDWISRQVDVLLASNADITGLNKVVFYSPSLGKSLVYEDTDPDDHWLCGATLAYKKSLWENYPFSDLQIGEDSDFLFNSGGKIEALDYQEGFVAVLHQHNTSIKHLENMNTVQWVYPT